MKTILTSFLLSSLLCLNAVSALEPSKPDSPPMNDLRDSVFPRHWSHLGPIESRPLPKRASDGSSMTAFHTDFLAAIGGEAAAVLRPGQTVTLPDGTSQTVELLEAVEKGWNQSSVGGRSLPGTCHYFYCELEVPADEIRYLYADFEGSPKVWINGELVLSNWRDKHILKPRDYGVRVRLKAGTNRCLVKVDSKQVWWLARLEFLDREAYETEVVPSVNGLRISEFTSTHLTVQTEPATFEGEYAFDAEFETADGHLLAMARGEVGHPVPVFRSSEEAVPDGTILFADIRSATDPENVTRTLVLQGSSQDALTRARNAWPKAREQASKLPCPWPGIYEAASGWMELLLASEGLEDSTASRETLFLVQQILEGLLAGENPLASLQGARVPVWFTWTDSKGQTRRGNYGFTLPPVLEADGSTPALYSLRGGSFRKVEVGVDFPGATQEKAKYEVDRASSLSADWIHLVPANLQGNWEVEMLEAIHAHAAAHLPIDPKRVYVTGGSLGGMGGWNWVAGSPNRFAGAVLRSGLGDAYRAPRAVNTPIWAICGGKDRLVINVERCVTRLQDAGGRIRYTLLPHNSHGGGPDKVSKEAQRDWLSRQVLSERDQPLPRLADLYGLNEKGQGEVREEKVPATRYLQVPLNSYDVLWDRRSFMRLEYRLLQGYRLHGRMIRHPSEVHEEAEGAFLRYPLDLTPDPTLLGPDVSVVTVPEGTRLVYRCLTTQESLKTHLEHFRREAGSRGIALGDRVSMVLLGSDRFKEELLLELFVIN